MRNVIVFKEHWNIWDKKVLEEVESLLDDIRPSDVVPVSLKKINIFVPMHMPILLVLVHRINKITGKQVILEDLTDEVYHYLSTMKLFHLSQMQNYKSALVKSVSNHNSTKSLLIPITDIQSAAGVNDFSKKLENILPYAEGIDRICSGLKLIMRELLVNSEEHSRGELYEGKLHIYAFCDEWDGKICLTVMDFGIGFLSSFLQNKGYSESGILTDKEAIIRVLEEHISCRNNGRGAEGYVSIEGIIDAFQGRLLVASGDAIVVYQKKTVHDNIVMKKAIKGSTVYVELCKNI